MLRFKYRLWRFADSLFGLLVRAVFALLRLLGPDRGPRIGAFLARNLGPVTGAHRIARENIAAAFPEKTEAERAAILTEAWDNLGRVACEYVHMDRIWDFDIDHPGRGRITATPETVAGVRWLQATVPATCVPWSWTASAVYPPEPALLLKTFAAITLLLVNRRSPS